MLLISQKQLFYDTLYIGHVVQTTMYACTKGYVKLIITVFIPGYVSCTNGHSFYPLDRRVMAICGEKRREIPLSRLDTSKVD